MASRSKTARLKNRGGELTLQQHETDSPIVPVVQLKELNTFKPDAVDWVIKQTEIEAAHRRSESHRVNTFIFSERLIGQTFALIIGLAGIAGGSYVALMGNPWAGTVIASLAIAGLAGVFLKGRQH